MSFMRIAVIFCRPITPPADAEASADDELALAQDLRFAAPRLAVEAELTRSLGALNAPPPVGSQQPSNGTARRSYSV